MNKVKFPLLAILLCICFNAFSQIVEKPIFKRLTYATYETIITGKGEKIILKDLLEVDAFGKAHYRSKYYNGVADTIYELSNNIIKKLNKIFNGKTPLKSHFATTKLKEGEHYAGNFDYLSYVSNTNQSDEIIVVNPFMTSEFNDALDKVAIPPLKANKKIKSIQDNALSARILKYQQSINYLPKIELPPPGMN